MSDLLECLLACRFSELCGELIKQNQTLTLNITSLVVPSDTTDAALCTEATRVRRELIRQALLGQAFALQACHRVRDLEWVVEQVRENTKTPLCGKRDGAVPS